VGTPAIVDEAALVISATSQKSFGIVPFPVSPDLDTQA
jgi:hypothetical protein